jgi:hypothetical protein
MENIGNILFIGHETGKRCGCDRDLRIIETSKNKGVFGKLYKVIDLSKVDVSKWGNLSFKMTKVIHVCSHGTFDGKVTLKYKGLPKNFAFHELTEILIQSDLPPRLELVFLASCNSCISAKKLFVRSAATLGLQGQESPEKIRPFLEIFYSSFFKSGSVVRAYETWAQRAYVFNDERAINPPCLTSEIVIDMNAILQKQKALVSKHENLDQERLNLLEQVRKLEESMRFFNIELMEIESAISVHDNAKLEKHPHSLMMRDFMAKKSKICDLAIAEISGIEPEFFALELDSIWEILECLMLENFGNAEARASLEQVEFYSEKSKHICFLDLVDKIHNYNNPFSEFLFSHTRTVKSLLHDLRYK